MKNCQACDSALDPLLRFCTACGIELESPACPACEARVDASWRYCGTCGHKLKLLPIGNQGEYSQAARPELRILHLTDLHMTAGDTVGLLETHGTLCLPLARRLAGILSREAGKVDHVLLTGDFTDTGSDAEYDRVMKIFEDFRLAGKMTLIPGNHDLVTGTTLAAADKDLQLRRFAHYGRPYLPEELDLSRPFPFIRWIGDRTAFIGLDTTGPGRSLYTSSTGAIDAEQLSRLQAVLDSLPDHIRKIVGLHHSLFLAETPNGLIDSIVTRYFMQLDNAAQIRELLHNYKNVIVLHGHHHFEILREAEDQSGLVSIGAASSLLPDEGSGLLNYHVLELYEDAFVSVKHTYLDAAEGISEAAHPIRRRFSFDRIPAPSDIAAILSKPGFQRHARERMNLERWRRSGRENESQREALKRPGFLRSATDKLRIAQMRGSEGGNP